MDNSHPPHSATADFNSLHIVAIGSSSGGLDAATRLVGALSLQQGRCYIIMQHLDPSQPSHLPNILAHSTQLPVIVASDGAKVQADHIYVVPPHTDLTLDQGVLRLSPFAKTEGQDIHHPIDKMFAAMAALLGERSVAIVLSGNGDDGAAGIKAIRAVGGLSMAQAPESAQYPAMPKAAIQAGAELVATPENIAQLLDCELTPPRLSDSSDLPKGQLTADEALTPILEWLRMARGADFFRYKYSTVRRRIMRRMTHLQLGKTEDYVTYLAANPLEVDKLYEDILIKVTSFFREPEAFACLRREVWPQLQRRKAPGSPIRIWVPGCATGEEAYSLAMCLAEDEAMASHPVQIFATDISSEAIAKARSGIFGREAIAQLSPERLARFFTATVDGFYVIDKALRDQCVFARQDVTRDPPFSNLDLVSCRNLLIYFTPPLQRRVLTTFHFALAPGGYLMLGEAEALGQSVDLFAALAPSSKIFTRRAVNVMIPDFIKEYTSGRRPTEPRRNALKITSTADALQVELARALCTHWRLTGVVVDESMEILQFLGSTAPYLRHQPGEAPSFNLFKLVPEELRVDLRLMIHEAATAERALQRQGLSIKSNDGGKTRINVEVVPLLRAATGQRHFLVLFSLVLEPAPASDLAGGNLALVGDAPSRDPGIARLTQELAETKAYLNTLIEAEQAANEELKSTSEELLSSNEELHSTNQELQTAREETQAINEELRTVNEELDRRLHELSQLHSDLTNTLASAQAALIMFSDQLLCRRITPAAERILGLDTSALGQPLTGVLATFANCHLEDVTREVIDTLSARDIETQDSRGRWYELRVRPFVSIDKKVDGAVIALRDIDIQKQLVRRLQIASDMAQRARLEAEDASRAKSEFLANVSHEIRTPLTTILGLAEALTDTCELRPDQLAQFAKIQVCIRQVTQLVDEILDLAKIEAGKLSIHLAPVNLLAELAETLLPLRERAENKGLSFVMSFVGALPQSIVTDAIRWRQILTNIVGNAVKFTDRGRIEVIFSMNGEGLLVCTVNDTGCGLTAAEQGRIFKHFGQGDSSFTRKFGGSGLGLCLAKQLATALGGDVLLTQSEAGKGSTFTASINPGLSEAAVMLSGLTEQDLRSAEPHALSPKLERMPSLAPMRILLADDSPDNRMLMTYFLERQGAKVTQVDDGAKALEMGLKNSFDLVLLDIQMPFLDGYDVCQSLRAGGCSLPIVALTAHAMQGVRERCLKCGFTEVLTKPIAFRQLIEAAARFLPKAQLP